MPCQRQQLILVSSSVLSRQEEDFSLVLKKVAVCGNFKCFSPNRFPLSALQSQIVSKMNIVMQPNHMAPIVTAPSGGCL